MRRLVLWVIRRERKRQNSIRELRAELRKAEKLMIGLVDEARQKTSILEDVSKWGQAHERHLRAHDDEIRLLRTLGVLQ